MEKIDIPDNKVKPYLVLGAFAVLVIIILVVVNIFLGPIIAQNSGMSFEPSFEVLPTADSFVKADVDVSDVDGVAVKWVVVAENGVGKTATVTVKGYADPMDVVVGVDSTGSITGVKVMENNETENIGSKAVVTEYTSQFIGKQSDTSVETIAGATVSSTAVNKAVKVAYDILEQIQ